MRKRLGFMGFFARKQPIISVSLNLTDGNKANAAAGKAYLLWADYGL
ncbi:MAG: hypothetical protein SPK05_01620 [Eubacteriales bacterium]|nr:hypothetical protein [Eubacteriales bacterium]